VVHQDNAPLGLLGLLRRQTPRLTMPGVLARMGVDLADNEQPIAMWLAETDGVDGYVVITDARLLVIDSSRYSTRPALAQEHPLSELVGAEVKRQHRGRRLVVDWRFSGRTVIAKLSAKELPRLHSILLTQARASDPSS
jgi:hypothetical protein